MELAETFEIQEEEPWLNLKAVLLNINPGYNNDIVNACKTLSDYVIYTSRVREYAEQMKIKDAVERAITECITEGILVDFLTKYRAEAKKMSIYEYDEDQQRQWDKEEGENRFAVLTQLLLKEQQTEKLLRATKDKNYRETLYQEYNL